MSRRALQSVAAALPVVGVGSVLAWVMLGRPATGIDDADIFFVYARHLADGHGFVYNIGGERVEGFTSMLWTVICSGFFKLTHAVEIPLYLFNLVLGTATVWACLRRGRHPVLFLALLLADPAWFAWCQVTLMETGLWSLLLTLLVLATVERRPVAMSCLMPLLVLTRPESMLWGVWLVLMLGWSTALRNGWRSAAKAIAFPAAAFAGSLLALVAFRMDYFGYPVPNTYYAKVSPNLLYDLLHGAYYLVRYACSNPAVLVVAATWLWMLVRGLRRIKKRIDRKTLIALCVLPGVGIPVLVGGDHFGGFRFYQPIWPILCLLAAEAWPAMLKRVQPANIRAVMLLLVVSGWALFLYTVQMEHEFRIAREGRETGCTLKAMFSDLNEMPTVATITAGGSKYGYPGTVFDLMGLNATEMAHAPGPRTGYKNHTAFNNDVFYGWHPDILLCGEDGRFDAKVLKGLPFEVRFNRMYEMRTMFRNGKQLEAYYSRSFLRRLPRGK